MPYKPYKPYAIVFPSLQWRVSRKEQSAAGKVVCDDAARWSQLPWVRAGCLLLFLVSTCLVLHCFPQTLQSAAAVLEFFNSEMSPNKIIEYSKTSTGTAKHIFFSHAHVKYSHMTCAHCNLMQLWQQDYLSFQEVQSWTTLGWKPGAPDHSIATLSKGSQGSQGSQIVHAYALISVYTILSILFIHLSMHTDRYSMRMLCVTLHNARHYVHTHTLRSFKPINITMHYITLLHMALYYMALHCNMLQYVTIHYNTLQYITLQYITLRVTTSY